MQGLSFDTEKHTFIVSERRVFSLGLEQRDRKKILYQMEECFAIRIDRRTEKNARFVV